VTYRISSDSLELRRGSFFTTLPIALERGDMALFDVGGFLLAGRWLPGMDGADWILVPGYRIRITGAIAVQIIGRVIPCPAGPGVCLN